MKGSRNFSWPSSQLSCLPQAGVLTRGATPYFLFFVRLVERDLNYRAFVAHFDVRGLLFFYGLRSGITAVETVFENID